MIVRGKKASAKSKLFLINNQTVDSKLVYKGKMYKLLANTSNVSAMSTNIDAV